jgi:hypothetical protein
MGRIVKAGERFGHTEKFEFNHSEFGDDRLRFIAILPKIEIFRDLFSRGIRNLARLLFPTRVLPLP